VCRGAAARVHYRRLLAPWALNLPASGDSNCANENRDLRDADSFLPLPFSAPLHRALSAAADKRFVARRFGQSRNREREKTTKVIAVTEVRGTQSLGTCRAFESETTREWVWVLQLEVRASSELKSHVNRPGNCGICRTGSMAVHAAGRKRRQLGEIGDNFEVPDEAYRRAGLSFLGRSLSYCPRGRHDDYTDHPASVRRMQLSLHRRVVHWNMHL